MSDLSLPQNDEVWKKITHPRSGCEYSVSSIGRIRRDDTGAIRKSYLTRRGYSTVDLWFENRRFHMLVHRAVAFAFIGPQPSIKHEIDHKNEIKTDNRPENLQWVDSKTHHELTHSRGQMLSGDDIWTRKYPERLPRGEQCHNAKLDASLVAVIRKCAAEGVPYRQIGRMFEISVENIRAIATRRTWVHIP